MITLTLNFTDQQFEQIQQLAKEQQFPDPERFIQSLIESSLAVGRIENLEQKLKEGFESDLTDWTPQDLEDIRREGKKLMESRNAV